MGFHPVLSIRYADEDANLVKTKVERLVTTKASQKEEEKSWGIFSKTKDLFNKFFSFFTGSGKQKDRTEEDDIQSQDWFVEEDAETGQKRSWRDLQNSLVVVARDVVQSHVINILRPFPPASRPGQFPAMRTGYLARSIAWRWRADTKKRVIDIGYKNLKGPTGDPAEYSQYLHHKGRLGIGDTAHQMMPKTNPEGVEIAWNLDGDNS